MSGRADLGHDTRSSFGPVYEEPMNGRCIANEDSAASVCSATSGELHHRFSAGPYDPPTMNKTNAQLRNDVIEARKEYRELLRKGLAPAPTEPENLVVSSGRS